MIDKEINQQEYKAVVEFLNSVICGANLSDDEEIAIRASRALRAFEADVDINIFSEVFKESECIPDISLEYDYKDIKEKNKNDESI